MHGITLEHNGWITLDGRNVGADLLKVLSYQVTLDEAYTLRSYFEMLEKYSILTELNDFFPIYKEQYQLCPDSGCCFEGIDYLQFSKTVEMIGFPSRRLEIYNSFKGISANEVFEIKSLQLGDLLDLPIKLGSLKHIVFGDRVDIFEFDTVYTLFELVDGIAWELSFHGTPDHCAIRR